MSALPGNRTTISQDASGFALSLEPPPRWRHPWWVTPVWTGREWVATVKPGTVNGRAPGYRTWTKQQQDFGFGASPLDGHVYFSADIFNPGRKSDPFTPIDVPIYQDPRLELRLRPIGLEGAPEDVVPEFFLDKGVEQRVTETELIEALERGENPTAGQPGARRLQAADIILHQPRAGLTIEVTIQPDFNGVSNVTQRLTIQPPDGNDSLRVLSGHWDPSPPRIAPLSDDYTEPNYDELLIATLYLLSPPGANEGEVPNGSWLPFVKHNLFWPLTYSAPPPTRARELSSGALTAPFVGGLFQPIINFFTAAAGDAADMALNWMQAQSNRGRWWTPTGGGSDAEFPIEPAQLVQPSGLGRAQRIAASEAQARQQQAAALRRNVLDPRFPFRAMPYSR